MKKKILLALTVLPILAPFLASCSALHVHTFTSPYETDETSHWKTCAICHEKFDQHSHIFNEINNKCTICDYTDPLVYLNEKNEVTGLTPYAKTKYTLELPHSVEGFAPGVKVFEDSDAVTVKLNQELKYYYEDTFSGSRVKNITTEEKIVDWKEPDSEGKIEKISVINEYEARIGDKGYKTLSEAFQAVNVDETTITLLRDKYSLSTSAPIEVSNTIVLETIYDNTMLSCDFNITNNGILYIPETITYRGNARLLLTLVRELRANGPNYDDYDNEEESVYSSGSIVFINKDDYPVGVNVNYVRSFKNVGHSDGYPAVGAKQVANELLIIPHNHFAFGTVRFSTSFQSLKGLTKYGQTVTELTLTSPFKDHTLAVGKGAFTIGYRLATAIKLVHDVHFYMFKSKGSFTDLTIGEGITAVNDYAFNNRIDVDIPRELVNVVPIVFSRLSTLRLGDQLRSIGKMAFYDCVSLTSIVGGKSLQTIDKNAFAGNSKLTTVDFSHCSKIKEIRYDMFNGCHSLSYLSLPPGLWKCIETGPITTREVDLLSYFPFDMTPEMLAGEFVADRTMYNQNLTWQRADILKIAPIYYTKSKDKDEIGRFKKVECTSSINDAIEKCCDDGEIYISEDYKGSSHTIDLKGHTKAMTINVAPNFKDFTIKNKGSNDISVKADEYLMLNNVKVKGKVTLNALYNETTGGTKTTAGFAIKGVDSLDKPQVNIVGKDGDAIKVEFDDVLSTKANINNETYDAYGIFNFYVDGDYTCINDTSPFGDVATSITYAHQTKDTTKVKANNGNTKDNNVTHITFSSDVESIAADAFNDFNNLEEITVEEGLKTIGASVFEGCDGLRTVTLPDSVTSIGEKAFYHCDKLSTINIPAGLTTISKSCFLDCPCLSSIVIPNKVKKIEANAFENCSALTSIRFPVNLETIGANAFKNCEGLDSIYIPDKSCLTTIGASAFEGCTNLSVADFASNADGWKAGETSLTKADLEDLSRAALFLKDTYCKVPWTREVPEL